jgi:hypothetical protein
VAPCTPWLAPLFQQTNMRKMSSLKIGCNIFAIISLGIHTCADLILGFLILKHDELYTLNVAFVIVCPNKLMLAARNHLNICI